MMDLQRPKISVITAVKNQRAALLKTISSVRAQTYHPIEYIVVDGGSTDGTQEVLKDNHDIVTKWISEPDKGISDAFNKGVQLSSGDYINFQGAGDGFHHASSIEELFADITKPPILLCGQVMRTSLTDQPLWVAPKKMTETFNKHSLLWKLTLPHQGLFTHRSFFEKWGDFDLNVKYAMDYEILLRAFHDFPSTLIKPVIVANWQAGGIGANQIKQVLKEYHYLKCKHKVAAKVFLSLIHEFNLFKLFVKTKIMKREA